MMMQYSNYVLGGILLVMVGSVFAATEKRELVKLPEDALAVATFVVRNVYGEGALKSQLPLVVSSEKELWLVKGTLHAEKGGVAEVWISKTDARVVKYTHGE